MVTRSKPLSTKIPEYVIYIILWIIFLAFPLITNDYNREGGLRRIGYDWLRMAPFLLVFLINNFLLLPVLFRGKRGVYILAVIVTIITVSGSFHMLSPVLHKNDPRILERRALADPHFGREEMNPSGAGMQANIPGPGIIEPGSRKSYVPERSSNQEERSLLSFANILLISLLIAGFNTSIAVTNRWFENEQAKKEIEKERIRTELAFLQNQISPHFFMNTLNNIHSLIEGDVDLARNAILRLSSMMRYLLYESGHGTTTLQKEIEFIRSYVSLMKLRVDNNVKVELNLPDSYINVSIPPLLFITFIENAFKYGVSTREQSYIRINLSQENGSIHFGVVNSIPAFRKEEGKHGGLGLENVKKRLDMLYGEMYSLSIDSNTEFIVSLIINYNGDQVTGQN